MSGYVTAQINLSKKLSERSRDYYLAKAGVERAIFEIKNDATEEYDAFTDSWGANTAAFKAVRLGDGTYSVYPFTGAGGAKVVRCGLSDEEGKINVNKAPKEVLKNIFQIQGGLPADEAKEIAASIINWRSPADHADKEGADAFHYDTLERPYKAKNAPIESLEELVLIKGITAGVFAKVRDCLTLYGAGAVNVNTAGIPALRAIGMSEELAAKIVHFRGDNARQTAENVFDDPARIAALLMKKESISGEASGKISGLIAAGLLSVKSDNFSGVAAGNIGAAAKGGGAKIAFVFDRKNKVIRYWKE